MKTSLAVDLFPDTYLVHGSDLLTPTLAIYPNLVQHNIDRMIAVLGGEPSRWRPHLKTVKLASMIELLAAADVTSAKCATTLELLTACQSGMRDVLVAYPHTGENARRIVAIAKAFPEVRVSVIVDSEQQVPDWSGTSVDLFIDINTGMDRTGVGLECSEEVRQLAQQIVRAGLVFRGLHFYDGNSTEADLAERMRKAHERYDKLIAIVSQLEAAGCAVKEVVTSGTPALPCSIAYEPLWNASFTHQVSAGTVVYNDASSLNHLPKEYGFHPAVVVISRVVSRPGIALVTCDAGHKSVSVDSGVPNCVVLGKPELQALKPSEEHLPFKVAPSSNSPSLGQLLYLIPRHICPTVNNFDRAALVKNGEITAIEDVTARGREGPLPPAETAQGKTLSRLC